MERENVKPDLRTGRLLYIDDPSALTPSLLVQYLSEGFCPVAIVEDDGVFSAAFVSYGPSDSGYLLQIGETIYISEGLDEPYIYEGAPA